jgi:hypothetical protein
MSRPYIRDYWETTIGTEKRSLDVETRIVGMAASQYVPRAHGREACKAIIPSILMYQKMASEDPILTVLPRVSTKQRILPMVYLVIPLLTDYWEEAMAIR